MNIESAIISITPQAEFVIREGVIEWLSNDIIQPTDAEIQAEVIRLQDIYVSQEYARNRKAEYDQLNQFELMTDDAINGTTSHLDAIQAVKDKYPKPE